MNEHAEPRLAPPGHARVALRGGLCILNCCDRMVCIDSDVFSLDLCGGAECVGSEQQSNGSDSVAIYLQETSG